MDVRHEALLILDKRGAILDTAREVSRLLKSKGVRGAVIGGVAVVLHGYVRTTQDVDLYVDDLQAACEALMAAGFRFDAKRRELNRDGVPVQLVTEDVVGKSPSRTVEREGIITVTLPDLITIKLKSGLKSVARAKDLADVVELIRINRLDGSFAARLEQALRSDFKKLVKAIRADGRSRRN